MIQNITETNGSLLVTKCTKLPLMKSTRLKGKVALLRVYFK